MTTKNTKSTKKFCFISSDGSVFRSNPLHYDTTYGIIASGGEGMASVEKIVDKMKRQPNGVRIEEADKVLNHYGYKLDRQKGSHRHYLNATGDVLTIVERKPTIKGFYVKEIISRTGV